MCSKFYILSDVDYPAGASQPAHAASEGLRTLLEQVSGEDFRAKREHLNAYVLKMAQAEARIRP